MEYPTRNQLAQIKDWQGDYVELMEFIRPIWMFEDIGYFKSRGRTYWLSTGGWSGNEEIISYLKRNTLFWMMCWQKSVRGGHYTFKVA